MDVEQLREYCLSKKGVTESFPFDDTALVFKVCGKIFAMIALDDGWMNLKCDPEKAIELREQYPAVMPGYHMNKKQWNTVVLDDSVLSKTICEWVDDSYDLVVQKLTKKLREALPNL
ncbi:MAG: MmcQ/YjbR family DNA-binding protein [Prevotellaceae bacterium]|jgi:predicted DNA-binding protein (MmcQ/YjbR family)|nr:MmcQ/YjbR family DNA-binding protein [Prevotellaceae bacterium]